MPRPIVARPIEIPVGPSIAYVPLTRGLFALIDRDSVESVGQFNWYAQKTACGYYASRGLRTMTSYQVLPLHALLASLGADHINGNSLDNRKCNLRSATVSQNAKNRAKSRNSKSRFKGVSWSRRDSKWAAEIQVDKRRIWLGYFSDELEAAKSYDCAARQYHGDFARLNLRTEGSHA